MSSLTEPGVRVIAAPVLEFLRHGPRYGTLLGTAGGALYLDMSGFVLALTAPGTPLMPNGIALTGPLTGPQPGAVVLARPGRIRVATHTISWNGDAPPSWEPRPALAQPVSRHAIAMRALNILLALGVEAPCLPSELVRRLSAAGLTIGGDASARRAIAMLLESVLARDPRGARLAAAMLTGLGPGLTPEGDDLLASSAATVALLGPSAGFEGPSARAWLAAVCLPSLARRTTLLSATLLRLATSGNVTEPLHGLLSFESESAVPWQCALARLERIGASTGRAYAVGAATTCAALGATTRSMTTTRATRQLKLQRS